MENSTTEEQNHEFYDENVEGNISSVIRSYNHSLRDANDKIDGLYKQILNEAKMAVVIAITLQLLLALGAIALFVLSVMIALRPNVDQFLRSYSFISFFAGIIVIVILIVHNPLKNIRKSIKDLVKITMILSGFSRQTIHVDAQFRSILNNKEINIGSLESTTKQLQSIIDQAIDSFNMIIDELQD